MKSSYRPLRICIVTECVQALLKRWKMSLFHEPRHTLPCSSQKDFCKNLLMQVRICSYETWQHMWAHTHKSGWYIKCQRIIHYCRTQFFVGSYRWCCSAGRLYSSFCALSHEVMTNVYKALKKVKSIPYVATGPLANVFLTVWGMWKFYHCASEECTIWISEALMGI